MILNRVAHKNPHWKAVKKQEEEERKNTMHVTRHSNCILHPVLMENVIRFIIWIFRFHFVFDQKLKKKRLKYPLCRRVARTKNNVKRLCQLVLRLKSFIVFKKDRNNQNEMK